jgi:PKD repeat protein
MEGINTRSSHTQRIILKFFVLFLSLSLLNGYAQPPPPPYTYYQIISFSAPATASVGIPVTMTATIMDGGNISSSEGGYNLFINGQLVDTGSLFLGSGQSTTISHTHLFDSPGIYTVTIETCSELGSCPDDSASLTIEILGSTPPPPPPPPPPPSPNQPPWATIEVFPTTVNVGELVTARIVSYGDPEGEPLVFDYDFGDGTIVTSPAAGESHSYSSPGTYTVRVRVRDPRGGSSYSNSVIVNVRGFIPPPPPPPPPPPSNRPPIADFTYSPSDPTVNQMVQFTDTSYDPDGFITSWNWNFGDGSFSTAQNPRHSFSFAGNANICLTVTDNQGASSNTCKIIAISSPAPPPPRGQEVRFKGKIVNKYSTIVEFIDVQVIQVLQGSISGIVSVATASDVAPGCLGSVDRPLNINDEVEIFGIYDQGARSVDVCSSSSYYIRKIQPQRVEVKFRGKVTNVFSVPDFGSITVQVDEVLSGPIRVGQVIDVQTLGALGACSLGRIDPVQVGDRVEVFGRLTDGGAEACSSSSYYVKLLQRAEQKAQLCISVADSREHGITGVEIQVNPLPNGSSGIVRTEWCGEYIVGTLVTLTAPERIRIPHAHDSFPADHTESFGYWWVSDRQSGRDWTEKNRAISLTISSSLVAGAWYKEERELKPPKADFTWEPQSPLMLEEVVFDPSPSQDPDGRIVDNEWDFDNDGKFEIRASHPRMQKHTFSHGGAHRVCLRVTDNDGLTDTACKEVKVSEEDDWPNLPDPSNPIVLEKDGSIPISLPEVGAATIEQALDRNGNGFLDDLEMHQAFDLWVRQTPVPGTDNLTISDQKMIELLQLWRKQVPIGQPRDQKPSNVRDKCERVSTDPLTIECRGEIKPGTDNDWMRIYLKKGQKIELTLEPANTLDAELVFGRWEKFSQNPGKGSTEKLSIEISEDGYYDIGVQHCKSCSTDTGKWVLRILFDSFTIKCKTTIKTPPYRYHVEEYIEETIFVEIIPSLGEAGAEADVNPKEGHIYVAVINKGGGLIGQAVRKRAFIRFDLLDIPEGECDVEVDISYHLLRIGLTAGLPILTLWTASVAPSEVRLFIGMGRKPPHVRYSCSGESCKAVLALATTIEDAVVKKTLDILTQALKVPPQIAQLIDVLSALEESASLVQDILKAIPVRKETLRLSKQRISHLDPLWVGVDSVGMLTSIGEGGFVLNMILATVDEVRIIPHEFRRSVSSPSVSGVKTIEQGIASLVPNDHPYAKGRVDIFTHFISQSALTFAALDLRVKSIQVEIYNLRGLKVFAEEAPGNRLTWHRQDFQGRRLANGVYLYTITVKTHDGRILRSSVRKLLILH